MSKKIPENTVVEGTVGAHMGSMKAEDLNACFAQMISGQMQQLYKIARKVLRKPEDVEDAVQTALLNAFQAFKNAAQEERQAPNIPAQLPAITRNAAIDILRRKKKQECLSLDVLEEEDRLTLIDNLYEPPEVALIREETWHMFSHVVSTLPPKLRFLLWLRFVQNHEYGTIVELIQNSPEMRARSGALRTQLSRGLTLLREAITFCDIRASDLEQWTEWGMALDTPIPSDNMPLPIPDPSFYLNTYMCIPRRVNLPALLDTKSGKRDQRDVMLDR